MTSQANNISAKRLVWRLLRKNISAGQIAGYAIANLIGLAIIMSALRFYADVDRALGAGDQAGSVVESDYIVLSRPVSLLNTLGVASDAGFSDADIAEIEAQPWAAQVGSFTAADFNVAASVSFQGNGMSTYMFLESVPDAFIDNLPREWGYTPGDIVPIMISKEYLALYNFGFASSRGMPQVTESIISKVPITLYLSGNGRSESLTGRIVGFSNRLNTVAVPQEFMEWANARYSSGEPKAPARLIVEVSNPGDPEMQRFIDSHDYEIAGDKTASSKMAYFLSLLTTIVVSIGAIICVLALFILMLSLVLLLQKNREKNQGLLLLGYSPMQVARSYFSLVAIVNLGVYLAASAAMLIASSLWQAPLRQLGLQPSSPLAPLLYGLAVILAITAINFLVIRRKAGLSC